MNRNSFRPLRRRGYCSFVARLLATKVAPETAAAGRRRSTRAPTDRRQGLRRRRPRADKAERAERPRLTAAAAAPGSRLSHATAGRRRSGG
jgi:hypothetical protein